MNHRIEALASQPVYLTWHENKRIYLSVKKERGALFLRLHKLFYDAPTPVLEALIRYALHKDPGSRAVIKQMAHLYFSEHRIPSDSLLSKGKHYDLREILDRICKDLSVEGISIGWSDRIPKGRCRSITFGTFDAHRYQIRIHPWLDDEQVPLYFLEFIVYHEVLHALCPSQMSAKGRRAIHTKEFRERERRFPQFQAAKEWEKKSLTFFRKRKSHGRS